MRITADIYTLSGAGWRATGGSQKVCNTQIHRKTNRLNN